MSEIDINYIASSLANLTSLPVRVYENGKIKKYYSIVDFEVDPFLIDQKSVLKEESNVGFYFRDDFFFYGYLNSKNIKLIVGPSRETKASKDILFKYSLELGLTKDKINSFIKSMEMISSIPLNTIITSLCTISHVLNKDKLNVTEILGNNTNTETEIEKSENSDHNTIDIENFISKMVKYGLVDEFKEFMKNPPIVNGGKLSNDSLNQTKNTFIVTTTICSRKAIEGGMSINDSLSLSDSYIRKADALKNTVDVINLQIAMIKDYIYKVHEINTNSKNSAFLIKLNNYIKKNISTPIKISDICKDLEVSKSTLENKIKKETELSVSEYINFYKINISKEMLKDNCSTISSIAYYLGYSSQAHFHKLFKKYTNTTPYKYKVMPE